MKISEKLKKMMRYRLNSEQDTNPVGINVPLKITEFLQSKGWNVSYQVVENFFVIIFVLVVSSFIFFVSGKSTNTGDTSAQLPASKKSVIETVPVNTNDACQSDDSVKKDDDKEKKLDESCTIGLIKILGPIVPHISPDSSLFASESEQTSSEDVCSQLSTINQDSNFRYAILEVDSPGGIPLAAEEIERCVKESDVPVIAYIRSSGTSAAYWAITSADRIFASALSDVGSIGVYVSFLDNVEKNRKEGLKYHLYSTGKFKDMLSPDKIATKEEENLLMSQLRVAHNVFVMAIAKNRNIPIETVRSIADGRVFDGESAALMGLVDQVGGLYEVRDYIQDNYKGTADLHICEF